MHGAVEGFVGNGRETATTGPAEAAGRKGNRTAPQARWARWLQRHLNGVAGVVASVAAIGGAGAGIWYYVQPRSRVDGSMASPPALLIGPGTQAPGNSSAPDVGPLPTGPACSAILFVPLSTTRGTIDMGRGKAAATFRQSLEEDGASVLRTDRVSWNKFTGVLLSVDWSVETQERCTERLVGAMVGFTSALQLRWPEPTRKRGEQLTLTDADTMPPRLRVGGEDVYADIMRRVRRGKSELEVERHAP